MTAITYSNGITDGRSPDGRIAFCSVNSGPRIDGRWAWRGSYCDANGQATDERVEAGLWSAACQVMRDVRTAHEAKGEELERRAYEALDRREAALDGIEHVRGGAYDPSAF